MAKEPKKPPEKPPEVDGDAPYETAHGPIPAEYWGNDVPITDKPSGEVFDHLTERDKALRKPKPKK